MDRHVYLQHLQIIPVLIITSLMVLLFVNRGYAEIDRYGTVKPDLIGERQDLPTAFSSSIYLPVVSNQKISILYGYVTYQGVPTSNIYIDLWRAITDSGLPPDKLGIVASDENGYYAFENVPSLGPGEFYFITYYNGQDGNSFIPNYLGGWYRRIDSINGGTIIADNFDLAAPVLLAPESGVSMSMPISFTWVYDFLPAGGHYRFSIDNSYSPANPFHTDVLVKEYVLTTLPPFFFLEHSYQWSVWICNANGGCGWMNEGEKRWITFLRSY